MSKSLFYYGFVIGDYIYREPNIGREESCFVFGTITGDCDVRSVTLGTRVRRAELAQSAD